MANKHHIEHVWQQFHKEKFPGVIIGSEEYRERRRCFYCGVYVMLGFISRTPESALQGVVQDITQETAAVLKGGESNVIIQGGRG